MYDVTYSIDGVIKHISIKANDSIGVMNAITNMFGAGKVQIIDMRRIQKEGEKMEENKVILSLNKYLEMYDRNKTQHLAARQHTDEATDTS